MPIGDHALEDLGRPKRLAFELLVEVSGDRQPHVEADQIGELSGQFNDMFFLLGRSTDLAEDAVEVLSDLRESGALEQDADVVMFIYREEQYDPRPENENLAEIIIGKQRNGPTGVVKLAFLKQCTRFANLTSAYD